MLPTQPSPRRPLWALSAVSLAAMSACAPIDYNNKTCSDLGWELTPTTLDLDCRCNQLLPLCRTIEDVDPLTGGLGVGVGPRIRDLGDGASIHRGFVWEERGEIVFAVGDNSFADAESASVWAVHWETNTRRLVSGGGYDPINGAYLVGDGPELFDINEVDLGPDGNLYLRARDQILRIDPDTGDRVVVWGFTDDELDPTQCIDPYEQWSSQALQPDFHHALAIDDDGNFYTGFFSRSSELGKPVGQIAADGSWCVVASSDGPDGIGGGVDFSNGPVTIDLIRDQLLVNNGSDLIRVDRATGDRSALALDVPPGQLQWDDDRELLWLTGPPDPWPKGLFTIDPNSGTAWMMGDCDMLPEPHPVAEACTSYPLYGNYHHGAGFVLPDGRMLHALGGAGLTLIELETGNNHIYNY